MKNAYAEFQALHRSWLSMRVAHKADNNFEEFGLAGAVAEDFDGLFEEWEKALAAAASKTKPTGADDKAIEAIIVLTIKQLNALVTPGLANGFKWLIQSPTFLTKIAELNTALTPVLDRRFKVRKEVVSYAKDELIDDIVRVERASPLADQLVAQQATITEQAGAVAGLVAGAQASQVEVEVAAVAIAAHLAAIRLLATDATSAKVGYDKTVAEATVALDEANRVLATVASSRAAADTQIDEGSKLIAASKEKLEKAIADNHREGLAASYHRSARTMGRERIGWLLTFFAALAYIALVASGAVERSLGATTIVSDVWWARLLHLLPLAAPGIWLGWFAARSAGLTARLQQDYEYKVATAQAYEGHKREVFGMGSELLATQLMEATIRNFGDNPIRLYGGNGLEGHPLESLKTLFSEKEYFDKVLKVLEAIKPSKL